MLDLFSFNLENKEEKFGFLIFIYLLSFEMINIDFAHRKESFFQQQ